MLKRLIVLVAMAAALVACSPAGTASSPATETVAPVESGLPSEMASESASPS
jgi:ABC-type proline/glycine betaine transport system substrate-binding protein